MCLTTKDKKIERAKEDITVYKLLRYCPTRNGNYHAPYRQDDDFVYKPGVNRPTIKSQLKYIKTFHKQYNDDKYDVYGGWLHAFTDTNMASYSKDARIIKMIIPKGTRIIRGIHSDICTKKLVWKKEETPCV